MRKEEVDSILDKVKDNYYKTCLINGTGIAINYDSYFFAMNNEFLVLIKNNLTTAVIALEELKSIKNLNTIT